MPKKLGQNKIQEKKENVRRLKRALKRRKEAYVPSPEMRRRREVMKRILSKSKEEKARSEGQANEFLNMLLPGESERGILNDEQGRDTEAIIKSILESEDEDIREEGVRIQVIGLTEQRIFRNFAKYEREELKKKGEKTEDDFRIHILKQGREAIYEQRDMVISNRVGLVLEEISEEKAKDNPDEEKRRNTVKGGVLAYVNENKQILLTFNTLNEEEQNKWKADFIKIFHEQGYDKNDDVLLVLFDSITADVDFAQDEVVKYDKIYPILLANIDKDLTEEEWQKLIENALEEAVKEEEEEAAPEYEPATLPFSLGYISPAKETVDPESVRRMGLQGHVDIKNVDGNRFKIRFPDLPDGSYRPLLDVVVEKGKEPMLLIQQDWIDADEADGDIDGVPARKCSLNGFIYELNFMRLDWTLNKGRRIKKKPSTKVNVNEVFEDEDLDFIGKNLLDTDLKSQALTKEQLNVFGNALEAIIRDDGTLLVKRIKKFREIVGKGDMKGKLYSLFKNPGGKVITIGTLEENANELEKVKKRK